MQEVGNLTLSGHAEAENEHIVAEDKRQKKVSAWVVGLGWRARITSGIAKPRCNPVNGVNGGKGRQETVSGSKGMREKLGGAEQADEVRIGNGKRAKKSERKCS